MAEGTALRTEMLLSRFEPILQFVSSGGCFVLSVYVHMQDFVEPYNFVARPPINAAFKDIVYNS